MQNTQKAELKIGTKSSIRRAVQWFRQLPSSRKEEVRQLLHHRYQTTSRYCPSHWPGTSIEFAYSIFANFNYQLITPAIPTQLPLPFDPR